MNEETMENFDEFFSALGDSDGYQTGEEESKESGFENEPADEENGAEGAQEAQEEPSGEESGKDAAEDVEKENGAENEQTPEMFTLKVNKQEKTVTREEVIALAQKGSDYDRVKEQADKSKSDNEALRQQLSQTQEVYDVVSQIAKDANVEIPALLDSFRVRRLMEQESLTEKEAKERLGRLKAEEKLKALQAAPEKKSEEQQRQERAEREIKEFRQQFPNVDISSLPVERLSKDIASGMSMTQAYLKDLNAQQAAQIEELNRQLKAKEQNAKNRASSPGSASDSGARKQKDQFDDFFDSFN